MRNTFKLFFFLFSIVSLTSQGLKASFQTDLEPTPGNFIADTVKFRSVADWIPKRIGNKFGYVHRDGVKTIKARFSHVSFFAEDCTLLHSLNPEVRKYGTSKYATVRFEGKDYRIDQKGTLLYLYNKEDLGLCPLVFKEQRFFSFVRNGFYGLVEKATFFDETDYRQYVIFPQFQYLHVLEGDDLDNPMLIAVKDNKFGVITIEGKIVIPFLYDDIKRNYAWKLGGLFEVSLDAKEYFFVDVHNRKY